jgi:chorismate dehydratase
LTRKKLRIGRIPYANLFPIFYMIGKQGGGDRYDIIDGVPSVLNRQLRDGIIDVSPSSSIEHLRYPDAYDVIRNHSISADGPIRSIFLFSRIPLEELAGKTILTSSQSETSAALVKIICRKFYHMTCTFAASGEPIEKALQSHVAYLLIGDDAISQSRRWPDLHLYDLGSIWKQHTGLPFTYALWLVRKESASASPEALAAFIADLDTAKEASLLNLGEIAEAWPMKGMLSADDLIAYWKGISYDLTDEHWKGLALFRQYAEELGLLP